MMRIVEVLHCAIQKCRIYFLLMNMNFEYDFVNEYESIAYINKRRMCFNDQILKVTE